MEVTKLTAAHAIKLASLAQHAEELLAMEASKLPREQQAAEFDRHAIRGLLVDPQVREILDDPANAVFLPVKRGPEDLAAQPGPGAYDYDTEGLGGT